MAAATLNTARRKSLAKQGKALPGGRYPIADVNHLHKAIKAVGRTPASKRPQVRAFIKRRAKALHAESAIPVTWKSGASLSHIVHTEAVIDLADGTVHRFRHGWIPLNPAAAKQKAAFTKGKNFGGTHLAGSRRKPGASVKTKSNDELLQLHASTDVASFHVDAKNLHAQRDAAATELKSRGWNKTPNGWSKYKITPKDHPGLVSARVAVAKSGIKAVDRKHVSALNSHGTPDEKRRAMREFDRRENAAEYGKGSAVAEASQSRAQRAAVRAKRATRSARVKEAERTGRVGNASMGDLAARRTDAQLTHLAGSNTPEGAAARAELTRRGKGEPAGRKPGESAPGTSKADRAADLTKAREATARGDHMTAQGLFRKHGISYANPNSIGEIAKREASDGGKTTIKTNGEVHHSEMGKLGTVKKAEKGHWAGWQSTNAKGETQYHSQRRDGVAHLVQSARKPPRTFEPTQTAEHGGGFAQGGTARTPQGIKDDRDLADRKALAKQLGVHVDYTSATDTPGKIRLAGLASRQDVHYRRQVDGSFKLAQAAAPSIADQKHAAERADAQRKDAFHAAQAGLGASAAKAEKVTIKTNGEVHHSELGKVGKVEKSTGFSTHGRSGAAYMLKNKGFKAQTPYYPGGGGGDVTHHNTRAAAVAHLVNRAKNRNPQ